MRSGARPNASRASDSASPSRPSRSEVRLRSTSSSAFRVRPLFWRDDLGAQAGVERRLRVLPLADLGLHVEQRVHDPRRLRPDLEGALGIVERLHLVAVAQRLGDQPAQAEERHLVVLEHGVERALGALAVAGELGGLRRQQQA